MVDNFHFSTIAGKLKFLDYLDTFLRLFSSCSLFVFIFFLCLPHERFSFLSRRAEKERLLPMDLGIGIGIGIGFSVLAFILFGTRTGIFIRCHFNFPLLLFYGRTETKRVRFGLVWYGLEKMQQPTHKDSTWDCVSMSLGLCFLVGH